jgi:hypothetical protein
MNAADWKFLQGKRQARSRNFKSQNAALNSEFAGALFPKFGKDGRGEG